MKTVAVTSTSINPDVSGSGIENASHADAREGNDENPGGNDENSGGNGSQVEAGLDYIKSFSSRPGLMPHWRNVLAQSRNGNRGSVTVLSFGSQEGGGLVLQSSHELSGDDLNAQSLATALGLDPPPDSGPVSNLKPSPQRAVLVSDLSEALINSLGPTFHLGPDVFEEHLIRSGYTDTSYGDRDSGTWPTRFLRKQHVSLCWHSLVMRKDVEPRDAFSRELLLQDALEWQRAFTARRPGGATVWRRRHLHALTNIFRQEWPLSSVYHPLKRRLVMGEREEGIGRKECLIDIGEDDELQEVEQPADRPDNELSVVAWEERVTFCWGSWNHGRLRT